MTETLDEVALRSLLAMVGDDPEFVDELVDSFLEDSPQQIAALRAAASNGDADGLVRPAHTLKGSSASLGARGVESIGRAIEERGRAGTVEGVAELLVELDGAYKELLTTLSDARQRRWVAP